MYKNILTKLLLEQVDKDAELICTVASFPFAPFSCGKATQPIAKD